MGSEMCIRDRDKHRNKVSDEASYELSFFSDSDNNDEVEEERDVEENEIEEIVGSPVWKLS